MPKVKLTEGTDEFPLHSPGDCVDEAGGGETSKEHVVQENQVKARQPVIPSEVPQQIKPCNS